MNISDIRKGLQVFGANNQQIGLVEGVQGTNVTVKGQHYPVSAFRMEGGTLYLIAEPQRANALHDQSAITLDVAEERLKVGKREVQAGEVEVRKHVVTENVSVPLELRREEMHVEQRNTPDRALRPEEMATLFQEAVIRVPLMAEEAVISKEAFVTGEVFLNKEATIERQTYTDSVRHEEVEVIQNVATTNAPPTTSATTALDSTISVLSSNLSAVQPKAAMRLIGQWQETLHGSDKPEHSAIATELGNLKGLLGAGKLDGKAIGQSMTTLGTQTTHAASSVSGDTARKLNTLGQLLRKIGQGLH